MLNDGLKQSNRLIIDQPQLTDRYMVHNIWKRIHVDRQDIIEIWIKDGDNLRCIYKKRTANIAVSPRWRGIGSH